MIERKEEREASKNLIETEKKVRTMWGRAEKANKCEKLKSQPSRGITFKYLNIHNNTKNTCSLSKRISIVFSLLVDIK